MNKKKLLIATVFCLGVCNYCFAGPHEVTLNVRNVSNGEISVDFSSPAGKNTCLRLSSASSGQSAKDYPVEEGATNVVVPTDKQNGTVSAISLVENGKLTENIKIVK